MIYKKIDENIKTFVTLCDDDKMINCLLYVSNIDITKSFVNQMEGVELIGEFPFINSLAVKTCVKNLRVFSRQTFVNYIIGPSKVNTLINVAKKVLNCKNYNERPTICFIDTGIKPHLDFCLGRNRIIKFVDLINNMISPYDDNGHGTFVAGVCSGGGNICNKYKGIVPLSNIVSIKALDKNGEAPANKILEAMQWVYDNHHKFNIKVVCMSFGSEPLGINDPIMKGAEVLWNKGVCVVAAAGNSGPKKDTIKSPGVSSKIITVGGFDDKRNFENYNPGEFEISNFSSRGPALRKFKPDVVAPSVDITSCSIDSDFYCALSGTSVAAPMIAGIMAVMLEKKKMNIDQAKRILLKSSKGITFNRNDEGYGYPDVEKILRLLRNY